MQPRQSIILPQSLSIPPKAAMIPGSGWTIYTGSQQKSKVKLHVVSPRVGVFSARRCAKAVACGKPLHVYDKLSFLAIFA
ncbi:hypothetical protein [Nostoc sp.]|uniref:hypothetical protein n=1 Tax=Nostoc sp. TaxID=1180 RepID=UPI002FF9BF41